MIIKIEKIGNRGYGIGYMDGRTIFVPYTIPGDEVEIELVHIRRDIAFAKLKSFISHSKNYRPPGCEAFGMPLLCGGCDLLSCNYESAIELKSGLLSEMFFGYQEHYHGFVASPQPYYYRNKVFMPLATIDKKPVCGIYERYTHRVVPHKKCLLQAEIFDSVCTELLSICTKSGIEAYDEHNQKGHLRHIGLRISSDGSQLLLVLVSKSKRLPFSKLLVKHLVDLFPNICGIVQNIQREATNVILGDEELILWGNDYLIDSLGKYSFRINYRSFFQINSATTALMYDYVKEHIPAGSKVIDAYSGIGSIGIYIAEKADRVLAIEDNPAAVKDAKHNAGLNNVTNISFACAKVEDYLKSPDIEKDYDTIIFDPPRKGLEPEIITSVALTGIKKIVYISCNPMTQRRDIVRFTEIGFKLISFKGFDMFPHTWHIESVAILSR